MGEAQKWTPSYVASVKASIANHLSRLNGLPMDKITTKIAMPYIRRLEHTTPDMATKVRQRVRGIFDYAAEDRIVGGNPIVAARKA